MHSRSRLMGVQGQGGQTSVQQGSCAVVGAAGPTPQASANAAGVGPAAPAVSASMANVSAARPFLKWAGGKRLMLPHLLPLVPEEFGTYFEPFVGGGALFWALQPRRAVLSDANRRLVRAYAGVRDDVNAVVAELRQQPHTKEHFMELRARDVDGMSDVDVACWLVYLNKTGFNGLYRVNRQGGFNVPFGKYKNPTICDAPNLRACSSALQGVKLAHADFEKVVARAEPGDFVYFDPPYLPVSATSSFTSYTSGGFTLQDHVRLRDLALQLKQRGVRVVISNSAAPAVLDLYAEGFDVRKVSAPRAVAARASSRGRVAELIIT